MWAYKHLVSEDVIEDSQSMEEETKCPLDMIIGNCTDMVKLFESSLRREGSLAVWSFRVKTKKNKRRVFSFSYDNAWGAYDHPIFRTGRSFFKTNNSIQFRKFHGLFSFFSASRATQGPRAKASYPNSHQFSMVDGRRQCWLVCSWYSTCQLHNYTTNYGTNMR